jgi:hypothetical protein
MKLFKKAKDSLLKKAKKKSKKKSAVATLEFVLVIPFVLVLFLMSLEFSFIMIEKHLMLSALYSAGREATRSLQEYSFGEHPKAGFIAFRNNLDLPARSSAEWQCHNWSNIDKSLYKSSTGRDSSSMSLTDKEQMCKREEGRVFTRGNNSNYQGCGACWCCKKRTDDSTANHDYNHIFINPSDPEALVNDPNIDTTDPNFDATHVSYNFGSFLSSPDPVEKPYACLPVFPDQSKIRQTYSCNAFSAQEIEEAKTSSVAWQCHTWSAADKSFYKNLTGSSAFTPDSADQERVCQRVAGRVFTGGNNSNYQGCGSCYCCQKKIIRVVDEQKKQSICERKGGMYTNDSSSYDGCTCKCCKTVPMSVLIKAAQDRVCLEKKGTIALAGHALEGCNECPCCRNTATTKSLDLSNPNYPKNPALEDMKNKTNSSVTKLSPPPPAQFQNPFDNTKNFKENVLEQVTNSADLSKKESSSNVCYNMLSMLATYLANKQQYPSSTTKSVLNTAIRTEFNKCNYYTSEAYPSCKGCSYNCETPGHCRSDTSEYHGCRTGFDPTGCQTFEHQYVKKENNNIGGSKSCVYEVEDAPRQGLLAKNCPSNLPYGPYKSSDNIDLCFNKAGQDELDYIKRYEKKSTLSDVSRKWSKQSWEVYTGGGDDRYGKHIDWGRVEAKASVHQRRCWYDTFANAKLACSATSSCYGVTQDSNGYEPRKQGSGLVASTGSTSWLNVSYRACSCTPSSMYTNLNASLIRLDGLSTYFSPGAFSSTKAYKEFCTEDVIAYLNGDYQSLFTCAADTGEVTKIDKITPKEISVPIDCTNPSICNKHSTSECSGVTCPPGVKPNLCRNPIKARKYPTYCQ